MASKVVYKIPYRRAPRLACRVRRASKGILHTTIKVTFGIDHRHLDPFALSLKVLISASSSICDHPSSYQDLYCNLIVIFIRAYTGYPLTFINWSVSCCVVCMPLVENCMCSF